MSPVEYIAQQFHAQYELRAPSHEYEASTDDGPDTLARGLGLPHTGAESPL